jgi:hypothetical protein
MLQSSCLAADINSLILRNGFGAPSRPAVRQRRMMKCQPACKPGSVGPARPCGPADVTAIPLGRSSPTASSNQPGWQGRKTGPSPCGLRHPYSVLLPAGLAMPLPLPAPRCALTAPFHPYPGSDPGRFAFCGAIPGVDPRRTLSGAVSPWSPDFPPCASTAAVRPTGERIGYGHRPGGSTGEGLLEFRYGSRSCCGTAEVGIGISPGNPSGCRGPSASRCDKPVS